MPWTYYNLWSREMSTGGPRSGILYQIDSEKDKQKNIIIDVHDIEEAVASAVKSYQARFDTSDVAVYMNGKTAEMYGLNGDHRILEIEWREDGSVPVGYIWATGLVPRIWNPEGEQE